MPVAGAATTWHGVLLPLPKLLYTLSLPPAPLHPRRATLSWATLSEKLQNWKLCVSLEKLLINEIKIASCVISNCSWSCLCLYLLLLDLMWNCRRMQLNNGLTAAHNAHWHVDSITAKELVLRRRNYAHSNRSHIRIFEMPLSKFDFRIKKM